LAGFVELGETLEDGVVREVFEESGVRVNRRTIRYIASQPWPFPQSLMIGFHAEAERVAGQELPEIIVDKDELEDARWVTRAELRDIVEAQLDGKEPKDLHIPGKYSLAWHIINAWIS